jgi:cold shock CspA family protein
MASSTPSTALDGKVVRIDPRGFGFVQAASGGEAFFFQKTTAQSWKDFRAMLGQSVRFEVSATLKGVRAVEIYVTGPSSPTDGL